jgi:hypothetical protein
MRLFKRRPNPTYVFFGKIVADMLGKKLGEKCYSDISVKFDENNALVPISIRCRETNVATVQNQKKGAVVCISSLPLAILPKDEHDSMVEVLKRFADDTDCKFQNSYVSTSKQGVETNV